MQALRFDNASADQPLRVSFIPLIDVVLQIICFYLFVSAGVQSYQDDSVQLPLMTSEPLAAEQPASVTVNILNDGSVAVNGEPIDIASLQHRITEARVRAAIGGDAFAVAIRADKRQQYASLDRVLQACREAEVSRVFVRAIGEAHGASQ
jgi:biopolymer transport protein ExbD